MTSDGRHAGCRIGILTFCICSILVQATIPIAIADDWPMFLQNPSHTGTASSTAAVHPKVLWQKTLSKDGFYASPTVHGGKVFIGGIDRTMYALNGATGETIWTYRTTPSPSPEAKGIDNTAAVAGGKVYFGGDDFVFYSVDEATGKLVWSYEVATTSMNPSSQGVQASAVVLNGVVYTGADAAEADKLDLVDNLLAIDADTGNPKWTFDTEGRVYSSPAVDGIRLFVGTFSGDFYVIDTSTGTPLKEPAVLWKKHFDHPIMGSPMLIDQKVFLGLGGYTETSGSYYLYSFRYDGTEVWKQQVGSPILSTPIPYDGGIYFADIGGNVYALDQDGNGDGTTKVIWRKQLSNDKVWATALISDGRLYIPSTDHRIYCLDIEGNGDGTTFEVWNMTLDGEIWASPVVADDRLYVATTNGTVYCIIEDPSPPASDEPKLESVGAEPSDPRAGTDFTITVAFATDSNLSKVQDVRVNLSALGGSSEAELNDHGSGGDKAAADGIFSYKHRVPKEIPEGDYELVVHCLLVSGKKCSGKTQIHVGPPATGGGRFIPALAPSTVVLSFVIVAVFLWRKKDRLSPF